VRALTAPILWLGRLYSGSSFCRLASGGRSATTAKKGERNMEKRMQKMLDEREQKS
jgi:hypothetical protein